MDPSILKHPMKGKDIGGRGGRVATRASRRKQPQAFSLKYKFTSAQVHTPLLNFDELLAQGSREVGGGFAQGFQAMENPRPAHKNAMKTKKPYLKCRRDKKIGGRGGRVATRASRRKQPQAFQLKYKVTPKSETTLAKVRPPPYKIDKSLAQRPREIHISTSKKAPGMLPVNFLPVERIPTNLNSMKRKRDGQQAPNEEMAIKRQRPSANPKQPGEKYWGNRDNPKPNGCGCKENETNEILVTRASCSQKHLKKNAGNKTKQPKPKNVKAGSTSNWPSASAIPKAANQFKIGTTAFPGFSKRSNGFINGKRLYKD